MAPMTRKRNLFPADAARFCAAISVLGAFAACSEDLGVCNDAAARTPYYNIDGFPAYQGQALVQGSCGGGGFCHSELAVGAARFGVAHGFNFDVDIASTSATPNLAALARLQSGQRLLSDERGEVYASIKSGYMPPGGEAEKRARAGALEYRPLPGEGDPLPDIASPAGVEIMRNWLACGAPVVERTVARSDGVDVTVGDIVPRLPPAGEVEPTFDAIWSLVLEPRCATPCHNPAVGSGMLDMTTKELAFANLVGTTAMGPECGGTGSTRVVAGDPEASLIIAKLEGRPVAGASALCGERMPFGGTPLSPETIGSLREWIRLGARND